MFQTSTMANLKTGFHELLTRPGAKHDEEISICSSILPAHRGYINFSLLESDLKMSKSHANVLSFDDGSYLSNLLNLYEQNEHFSKETSIENTTNIGTIDEFVMRNERTCVVNQDNKHRLEDLCNDLSISKSRNGVGEVSERSRNDQNPWIIENIQRWRYC